MIYMFTCKIQLFDIYTSENTVFQIYIILNQYFPVFYYFVYNEYSLDMLHPNTFGHNGYQCLFCSCSSGD